MANKPRPRRKTGEKPSIRQPLKMDKLPQELLDRVMKERAAGRTWMEIEALSPKFEEWEKTAPEIRAEYPQLRLPHTTLQRWYDLRVEQVKHELLADQTRAREIAAIFYGKESKDLPDAVRNAISDQLFAMMQSADGKSRLNVTKGLLALGELLNEQRKTEIKDRRQKAYERELQMKIEAMRDKVARLKKDVDGTGKKKQLTPEELKQRVDEIYGLAA